MRRFKEIILVLIIIFIGIVFFYSCGGGGGGGGGDSNISPSIPYSGINTPAVITSENAVTLASGAYFGMGSAEQPGDIIRLSAETQPDKTSDQPQINTLLLPRIWERAISNYVELHPPGQVSRLARIDERMNGLCDGYADMDGSINENNGNFSVNVNYQGYSDDCVLYISGRTNESGNIDPYSLYFTHTTTTYEALVFTIGGSSITQSGTWFTEYIYPQAGTVRDIVNIVTRDDATNKTYWMKEYNTRSFIGGYGDSEYREFDITGRYYDPDYGYVDITTEQVLRIRLDESYPYQGVLILTGDGNTKARWEMVSTAAYQVTGDTDGDDEFDDFASGSIHWPGENSPPVAKTGSDQWEVPGCRIILSGSGSSDTDLDVLTYDWSIVSSPDGSTATLSAPNSANPSFTPDLVGDYIVQVIVNDGFENSAPDTVAVFIRPGNSCGDIDTPPVAHIIVDYKTVTGCPVTLDGSSSSDYDGDPITFAWSFASVPGSSSAVLSNPNSSAVLFTPDVAGDYTIELVVNDGLLDSVADSITTTIPQGYFCEQGILVKGNPSMSTVTSVALALGDINGDGNPDIAVPTRKWEYGVGTTTQLVVFTQNTGGQFASSTAYPGEIIDDGGGLANSVDMGDLNSDGRTDIVMAMHNGVGVFEQHTSGGFNAVVTHPVNHGVNSRPNQVRIADLDNDGRQDIVSTTWGTDANEVDLFYQDTQGTLGTPVTYTAGKDNFDLVVDDINSDEVNDIVLASRHDISGEIVIFKQNTGGTFDGPFNYDLVFDENNDDRVRSIAVGDINSDGRKDIVASFSNNTQPTQECFIAINYQNSSSTLDSPIFYPSDEKDCVVETADMNVDGKVDIISACPSGTVEIFLHQPDGSLAGFSTPPLEEGTSTMGTHAIAVDDIDGDGFNDVAIMHKNNVRLLYNNGLLD